MPNFRSLGPGLVITGMVALAASWLAEHYSTPVMLFALLLGIAVNFLSRDERCKPGIEFASRSILRVGVALLGARITFDQIQSLGGGALVLTASAVLLTILCGIVLARSAGLARDFGLLTGGAVAICGASAALAIASVLPRGPDHERDTIMTVVAVTALSTIAMVLYPLLAGALGFDPHTTGIFLGATIHDVAQVVGAGYSVSPRRATRPPSSSCSGSRCCCPWCSSFRSCCSDLARLSRRVRTGHRCCRCFSSASRGSCS